MICRAAGYVGDLLELLRNNPNLILASGLADELEVVVVSLLTHFG